MNALWTIILVSITFGRQATGQGTVPCHRNKNNLAAWSCESVTLPYNLCKACPLKPANWNGDFKTCNSIYDLDAPGCKWELQEYVKLNQCDWKRKDNVNKWINGANWWEKTIAKEDLDYMVYSLCEQCCDCIPKRSSNINFWEAKWRGEDDLYDASRGNCAAHAHFDVCSLFPNIRFFRNPWGPWNWWWPKICWQIKSWVDYNPNWIDQNDAKVNWPIARFLRNINRNTACNDHNVWNKCKALESSQKRI